MRGHNKEIWLSLSRGWVLERCLRALKNEEWGEGIGRKVMWQKSRNLGFQMPDTLWFQFRSPRIHTRNMHFHKHFRQSISSTNIYWARKWAWDSSRCWEFSNFFLINFSAFWFRGMISPKATQSMVFRASFRPAILRSWKIQQVRSKQGSWRESYEGHRRSIQVLRNRSASYEWVYLSTKGIRMTVSEEDTLVFKIQDVQPGIYSRWYTLSSPSPNLSLKVQL